MLEESKPPEVPAGEPASFAQMPGSLNPPEFYYEATVIRKKVGTNEVLSVDNVRLGHNYLILTMEIQAATPEQIAAKKVPLSMMIKTNIDAANRKEDFGGLLIPFVQFMQGYHNSCVINLSNKNKIIIPRGGQMPPPQDTRSPFRPPRRRR